MSQPVKITINARACGRTLERDMFLINAACNKHPLDAVHKRAPQTFDQLAQMICEAATSAQNNCVPEPGQSVASRIYADTKAHDWLNGMAQAVCTYKNDSTIKRSAFMGIPIVEVEGMPDNRIAVVDHRGIVHLIINTGK